MVVAVRRPTIHPRSRRPYSVLGHVLRRASPYAPFNELNAVALGQAELVGAAGLEVVHDEQNGAWLRIARPALAGHGEYKECGAVGGVVADVRADDRVRSSGDRWSRGVDGPRCQVGRRRCRLATCPRPLVSGSNVATSKKL